tara:strand:- start:162 stop:806 length:645 start_codon:yes stop_codon:yes gene_type:complete
MNPPMHRRKTLTEYQREEINRVVKDVLREKYTDMELVQLSIKEDAIEKITDVSCKILFGKKSLIIKGTGKGPVDALFTAITSKFVGEYCSLGRLHFSRFSVEADIEKNLGPSRTDATVEATLEISNECGSSLFRQRDNSISIVSAKIVLSAVEHFINAEKCVIMLYKNLQHAEKRARGDMMNIYTQQMAEIIKNVSYEKVIERLKNESRKNTAI